MSPLPDHRIKCNVCAVVKTATAFPARWSRTTGPVCLMCTAAAKVADTPMAQAGQQGAQQGARAERLRLMGRIREILSDMRGDVGHPDAGG